MADAYVQKYLPVADSLPSFWLADAFAGKDAFHNHRTTPELPAQVDVVIIGAGYAGTSVAWHLTHPEGEDEAAQPVPSIALVEARGVCSGATGRNGGHLRPDLYGHIATYAKRSGPAAAAEVAEFEASHVWALKALIERERIDCDFVLGRSWDVWVEAEAAAAARKAYGLLAVEHGLPHMRDVFFTDDPVTAARLSGIKGARAAASYTAGMLWPYKLVRHLLKALVDGGGVNLQTNTPVIRIDNDSEAAPGGGFLVVTPRGTIRAGKVVHATNGYAAGLLPEYAPNIVPCKGNCTHIAAPPAATAPILNNSYIVRDADKVLSYLVPRPAGDIIVGGAAALYQDQRDQWYGNVDDSTLIDVAPARTYWDDGYMQRTFRGWEATDAHVDTIWSGVMGYSYDSHSHVGPVPGRSGQYICAGFNGHGMPVVWLSGRGVARMLRDGVPYSASGVPRLFETTAARLKRAAEGREEDGDILG